MDFVLQHVPALGLEIAVPADWSWTRSEPEHATFQAPARQGYRATLSLASDLLAPPTPARFEEVIRDVPAALSKRHPGTEVLRETRFAQAGMPAWLVHFRWLVDAKKQVLEQVMVLMVTDIASGKAVQIDGSMLASNASRDLPVFKAILQSLKPVPEA
ncbi:MAG: hypothetical protein LAT50_13130 [Ectothiorhodospiraceae bacterium]|nr:hypothetical protein [Ectothiorhodospiraceae bacterium]